MTFGIALLKLKEGRRLRRRGWNGREQYIVFHPQDMDLKTLIIWRPFIYIVNPHPVTYMGQGKAEERTPWTASQVDMLSDDWEVVDD